MKKIALALAAIMMLSILSACAPSNQESAGAPADPPKETVTVVPAMPSTSPEAWDREVDLLVMGCGPAGVSAAVEAADNGCPSVLILEKTAMIGGTGIISEGILAGYETQITKKYDVHITAQDCYDRMMMLSNYRVDKDLTWVTAEKCGETIDWLIDVLHVPFVDEVVVNPTYGPMRMIHNVEGKGPGFLEPFQNALDSRGIEVLLETPGTKLIGDENGRVIGAIATTKDGQKLRIKANAVVLATGGFGNNAELVGQLVPLYKGCLPVAHVGATGDGLLMATEMGAAVANVDLFRGSLADYEVVTERHIGGFQATISGFLAGGGCIVVGKDGQRFTDEKQRKCDAFFVQMRKDDADYLWAVNDQKGMDETKPERAGGMTYTKADTLEELAQIMGVPADNLIATVARWNELAAQGVDEDFGRTANLIPLDTPPYYAVKTAPGSMGNYGGLVRSVNSEVLKVNGDPVPGLYVAGGTAAVATENGWTMSHAFTTGRLAGRSSWEYIQSLED